MMHALASWPMRGVEGSEEHTQLVRQPYRLIRRLVSHAPIAFLDRSSWGYTIAYISGSCAYGDVVMSFYSMPTLPILFYSILVHYIILHYFTLAFSRASWHTVLLLRDVLFSSCT